MIDQNNANIHFCEICFECQKELKINEPRYLVADMTKTNVRTFPNGLFKQIVFCHPCWDLIAGKRYTFSKEAPLPKDIEIKEWVFNIGKP